MRAISAKTAAAMADLDTIHADPFPATRAPGAGTPGVDAPADECVRCGYSLHGIADDQPCPECGLLAQRSRRLTDELHDTRPGWLRRLSVGVWLLLLTVPAWIGGSIVLSFVVDVLDSNPFAQSRWRWAMLWQMQHAGPTCAAAVFAVGVWLLTCREGYAPADAADRRLRTALRALAFLPLTASIYQRADDYFSMSGLDTLRFWDPGRTFGVDPTALLLLPAGAIPFLLFRRLRGLAHRARSAYLAEHCTIVGAGATLAVAYAAVCWLVFQNVDRLGLPHYWTSRATTPLVLSVVMTALMATLVIWSVYLLVRFAISFGRASRMLRRAWLTEDRSIVMAVD